VYCPFGKFKSAWAALSRHLLGYECNLDPPPQAADNKTIAIPIDRFLKSPP
jgi:hypothetical protein